MKARVYLEATMSLAVTVNVPDGLDPEEARDAAIEAAYEQQPRGICAQCAGWRETWGKDEGEYEVIDGPDAVELIDPPAPAVLGNGEQA